MVVIVAIIVPHSSIPYCKAGLRVSGSGALDLWVVVKIRGPFLGTLNIRGRIILGTQTGTIIFDNHPCRDLGDLGCRFGPEDSQGKERSLRLDALALFTQSPRPLRRGTQQSRRCRLLATGTFGP